MIENLQICLWLGKYNVYYMYLLSILISKTFKKVNLGTSKYPKIYILMLNNEYVLLYVMCLMNRVRF